MRIISIGDLVTDFYYKNGKLVGVNGGMTSHNIIANIAKLGLETSVCGVCGDDMAGTIAINSLKEVGTNIDNVKVIEDINTRCFHVSYQELNEIFSNLQKKYYGKNLKFSKNSEINWCRITHFFSPFYTYKYATGVTCACYVASNIENEEYKEKYLNFLKSGCKKDSLELLEDINIDLTKEETFEHTVKLLNDLMDEFEELYKEVNDE